MKCTAIFIVSLYLIDGLIIESQNPIGLRASSNLRGILFGTAISVDRLRNNVDNDQYNSNIRNNYHLVVPEGELKPMHLWWGDNIYHWTDPDWLVGGMANSTGWVQENKMQLRGHNLVWPKDNRIPKWLLEQESSITPEKAQSLLSDYIHTVVSRYRGKIPWWDVVNEAIDDSQNNSHPFNLRNSFWFRKLGPDFMKYAFIYAHEADPDAQLYYNEYDIQGLGLKTNRTLELVSWLRSEGAIVNGIGIQWHINLSTTITPGDTYYQSAQQFIDHGLDFMVTELDVAVPTKGGYPINPEDLEKQGFIYRSILDYVLNFSPKCRAMLTWGFTDRYSWLPDTSNYTKGAGLPLDWMYIPKPAYWQIQEDLARVLSNGIYRLSPQSQPDKCLGTSDNGSVQLYSGACNEMNQRWNITWLGDGTYRFSPESATHLALDAFNTTAPIGGVQTNDWSGDVNQEWAFSPQGNNKFRIVPRTAWWRTMTVYNTSNIGIIDHSSDQDWFLNILLNKDF
jgi:endo-1,4-beta-xylanase